MSKKEATSFEAVGLHPAVCASLAEKNITRPLDLQQKTLLHTVNDFADVIAEAPSHSGRHTLISVFAAHCILAGDQPKRNVLIVANNPASSSKLVTTFNNLLSATKIPIVPCLEDRPPKFTGSNAVLVGALATFAKWSPEYFSSTITFIVEDCSIHDEKQLHATIETVIGVAPTTNLFFLSSTPPSDISVSIRYLFRRTNRRYYFTASEQPRFSYIMCHDGDDRNILNERLATIKGFKNILILTHNREVRELKAHLHQRLGIKTFSIQRNTTGPDHDRVLGEFLRSPYAILVAMDAYTGVDLMDLDAVIQFYPPQKSMPEEEWADFVSFLQLTGDPSRPTTIITLVAPDDFSLVSYFMRRVNGEGPVVNVSPNHPQFAAAVLNPQVAALEKMRLENTSLPSMTVGSPLVSTTTGPVPGVGAAATIMATLPLTVAGGVGAQTSGTIVTASGVNINIGKAAPPPPPPQQQLQKGGSNGPKATSPVVNTKDQLALAAAAAAAAAAAGDVPLPRSQRSEPAHPSNNNNKQFKNNNGGGNNGKGGGGNNNYSGGKNNQQQGGGKPQQQQQNGNKQNSGGGNNNNQPKGGFNNQQQPNKPQQASNNNATAAAPAAGNAAAGANNNNNDRKNKR